MYGTVHALLMRELKTRFGANRLGYFWALFDPIMQAAVIGLLFTFIGRSSLVGVPVALFIISGILPFQFFSQLLPQLSAAVQANKNLLSYKQVTAIDPILTRILIETATFIIVYTIILSFMAWLGLDVFPDDILALIAASTLLLILGIGIGLLLCSAITFWKDTGKILQIILRPMFFISGIFFCATMIPSQYWYLFSWNPIFHIIELSRDALFDSYTTPIGDWVFVSKVSFISLGLGLMTFKLCRQRFIAP
jgi:capsular polysaccharide transport system permease protein